MVRIEIIGWDDRKAWASVTSSPGVSRIWINRLIWRLQIDRRESKNLWKRIQARECLTFVMPKGADRFAAHSLRMDLESIGAQVVIADDHETPTTAH